MEKEAPVDYVIIDDIGGIACFPKYKQWLGHHDEIEDEAKWVKRTTVKWGRPAIWLSNNDPRLEDKVDVDWLEANCTFVHITNRFYGGAKRKIEQVDYEAWRQQVADECSEQSF